MPLISAGIMHGKRCTGDRTVDYMLRRIARFESEPVVADGKVVTARATVDTPASCGRSAGCSPPPGGRWEGCWPASG